VNNHDNHWKELCQAILNEPDPVKLQELARTLNDELEAQEKETAQKRNQSYFFPASGASKPETEYS
jgi:hypothetical protein